MSVVIVYIVMMKISVGLVAMNITGQHVLNDYKKTHFKEWDGTYEKQLYEVWDDGEIIEAWPNAGKMIATDGSGREWLPGGCLVRVNND